MKGVVGAVNEADLYQQLQATGLELLQCSEVKERKGLGFGKTRIKNRDLVQLFLHLEQLQSAGVPLLDALSDIRDTTENDKLRDVMSEIYRSVAEGASLSEAMAQHSNVFSPLTISLVKAGEHTGDLTFAYKQLIVFLKWIGELQSRIKKATRYPMILAGVVLLTITVMMGYVVPQVVGFISTLDQELPFYTIALIKTSEFFQSYWMFIFALPVILFFAYKALRKGSESFCYKMDVLFLRMPVAGTLIRKISIARYAQTFGALYASGITILGCLKSARNTVTNRALLEALSRVEESVKSGSPLSEAFNESGEFPSMVIRMLKIGEESGNLSPVLQQVSDFYTKDVDEAVEGMVQMIEPTLTAVLGGMILWIAAGVFGPIYSSFSNMEM